MKLSDFWTRKRYFLQSILKTKYFNFLVRQNYSAASFLVHKLIPLSFILSIFNIYLLTISHFLVSQVHFPAIFEMYWYILIQSRLEYLMAAEALLSHTPETEAHISLSESWLMTPTEIKINSNQSNDWDQYLILLSIFRLLSGWFK